MHAFRERQMFVPKNMKKKKKKSENKGIFDQWVMNHMKWHEIRIFYVKFGSLNNFLLYFKYIYTHTILL